MHKLIELANSQNRNLREPEARALLQEYGISSPPYGVAADARSAVSIAETLGYPVAMKIISDVVSHKSDAGGVLVNLCTANEVELAFNKIISNVQAYAPDAVIEGILVSQYIRQGVECIAGITRDRQLGTALMFGLGGIFVEVLQDVSIQLLPVTFEEATHMVTSIKGARLLTGYRGNAPKDINAVVELMMRLGKLAEENPEIQEIDINPFFAYEQGVVAVDARIVL